MNWKQIVSFLDDKYDEYSDSIPLDEDQVELLWSFKEYLIKQIVKEEVS